jgi:hypothetical protein
MVMNLKPFEESVWDILLDAKGNDFLTAAVLDIEALTIEGTDVITRPRFETLIYYYDYLDTIAILKLFEKSRSLEAFTAKTAILTLLQVRHWDLVKFILERTTKCTSDVINESTRG